MLTPAQVAAVGDPASMLQIMAGAGSGKTEVLARRTARLLSEVPEPSSVIAFTFTEKAAGELKARIEARAGEQDPKFRELPPVGRGMFIGTTHSWALQALRELGGSYETMDGLSEEEEWVLLHRFARRLGVVDLYGRAEGKESERISAAAAVSTFLSSAEVVQNERLDRSALRSMAPDFCSVLERYERLLEGMRLLPFRMMIDHTVRELSPGGRLSEKLCGRVSHVLVDEFQDFNVAQDQLLQRLGSLGADITVVGDDDQAIYQWRGGDVRLFSSFDHRFPAVSRALLGENHRCRPEIVHLARALIEKVPDRASKIVASAREESARGAVEMLIVPTAQDEARAIALRIASLLDGGLHARDIGVLYRSVRTSARPLVAALRERGIPLSVVGKTSLLARPEMALIAHVLVYWAGGTWYPNPDFAPEVVTRESLLSEISAVTGWPSHRSEVAIQSLDQLGEQCRQEGIPDSILLFNDVLTTLGLPGSGDTATSRELGLGQISELLTVFDHAARRSIPYNIQQELAQRDSDETDEDETILGEEGGKGKAVLEMSPGELYLLRLRAFLEEFAGRSAEETPDATRADEDVVQIMTVHQAKGLEFPVVFVPCLVEGRFPTRLMGTPQLWYVPPEMFDRARYEGKEEDEARLLYVAMTRPRELLVLSSFQRHETRAAKLSRFLTEYLRTALATASRFGEAVPAFVQGVHEEGPVDVEFSSLVTFQECAYKYWLRHECGFQPPLAKELGFGKLLHHVVAELAREARRGVRPTEGDVDRILEESFYLPFAGPVPAANLRRAAGERVKAYVRGFGDELLRCVQPEMRFEVPLKGARIRGRIDLVVRSEDAPANQVVLIDFKTSSNRPPSEMHINQLRLYAAAAERLGLEPVGMAIHDLDADQGGRSQIPHDDAAREGFSEQLETFVHRIRHHEFPPTRNRAHCDGCDFRAFCKNRKVATARHQSDWDV